MNLDRKAWSLPKTQEKNQPGTKSKWLFETYEKINGK